MEESGVCGCGGGSEAKKSKWRPVHEIIEEILAQIRDGVYDGDEGEAIRVFARLYVLGAKAPKERIPVLIAGLDAVQGEYGYFGSINEAKKQLEAQKAEQEAEEEKKKAEATGATLDEQRALTGEE